MYGPSELPELEEKHIVTFALLLCFSPYSKDNSCASVDESTDKSCSILEIKKKEEHEDLRWASHGSCCAWSWTKQVNGLQRVSDTCSRFLFFYDYLLLPAYVVLQNAFCSIALVVLWEPFYSVTLITDRGFVLCSLYSLLMKNVQWHGHEKKIL